MKRLYLFLCCIIFFTSCVYARKIPLSLRIASLFNSQLHQYKKTKKKIRNDIFTPCVVQDNTYRYKTLFLQTKQSKRKIPKWNQIYKQDNSKKKTLNNLPEQPKRKYNTPLKHIKKIDMN